jgi:phospholipid-binding lipoprotein MlaA
LQAHRIVSIIAMILMLGQSPVHGENPENQDSPKVEEDIYDPLEGYNRAMFEINWVFDTLLFAPLAEVYGVVPSPARKGVRNVLTNLKSPVTFINDLLQLEGQKAGQTLARTLINTTLGIGGIFDVATEMGLDYHSEDFGQTLAVIGIPSGPYMIWPFFGPLTPRDVAGKGGDFFMNPVVWALGNADQDGLLWGAVGADLIDKRTEARGFTAELKKAIDPYAVVRSLYWQTRVSNINDGVDNRQDSPKPIDQ